MGIPRFYRLITEQFPTVSEHTSFKQGFSTSKTNTTVVDNLYLDANGILHNCAREIYFPNQYNKPRLSRGGKKHQPLPTADEQLYRLFKAISSYIDQLLKFVKPQKVFYIAIDGPAPLAKQAQQRQRRYKAADQKTSTELDTFDSTAITPGTTFMYKLGQYLQYYIRKMMTIDPVWKNITVIFSGADVPGEGEHKIVQYIREQQDRNDLVHCMYGLDADLFMLSLGTQCPKFYLLREDQFNTVWNDTLFYKVNIGQLRKELYEYWGSIGGNENQLVNDFIFICFLVGNDFLHALPCCHDLSESINFVMDLRKQILGSSYITNGTGFSLNNLTILLSSLASTEEQAISAQFYHQNFPNITLNSSLKNPDHPDQGIELAKYREKYYSKAGVDYTDQHAVWAFCKHYLQGLEWVQYYYHAKPNNWQWYYPYHYSPLTTDLVDYLTNASSGSRLTRVSNKCLEPVLPFHQLLCVVPPRSKTLLPRYLQHLYNGKLAKFYPTQYKLDLEGKMRDWEAVAILPFIEIDQIVDAYDQAVKAANEKGVNTKLARNVLGKTTSYRYSSNINRYTYTSAYGKIRNCPIATTLLF